MLSEGYGFLRSSDSNYLPSTSDIYVSPSQIKRFNLATGDEIAGQVRKPKDGEKYYALLRIESVNQRNLDDLRDRPSFEKLVPYFPEERFILETTPESIAGRVMDLLTPIGKGQRALIVSPPRAGKTILLQQIANSISENTPDAKLIILLIDERPEEVTDMKGMSREM